MPMVIQSRRQAGISLLEVLMAISLLGVSFVTIFSGLSAALRATGRLDAFDRGNEFATRKLNELFLDPSLAADQRRFGTTPSGIEWEARTELLDQRPLPGSQKSAQLVRINLQVSWGTRSGRQNLNLESLKLCIPPSPPSP
jgi:type II secretory pathway pseudopilin PulG